MKGFQETCRPEESTPEPAGLYVHVPFCSGKCAYCDFYSITASPDRTARWLRALASEAALFTETFPRFDTLYLGGGTPSVLSDREPGLLMETLTRSFRFAEAPEITLEANPDDVTPAILHGWQALGINRVSLGVQSLEDRHLALLGRRHDAAQAVRAMEAVRDAGFDSWSADLIFGLPGQEPDTLEREIERLVSFLPDHVSCYQLTLAEGTPLHEQHAQGLLKMPDEEQESRLFLAASNLLENLGYLHYEVSNFAGRWKDKTSGDAPPTPCVDPPGWRTCRHNRKYWDRSPVLGLGPSAHSLLGNERWWNPRSLDRYCETLETGRPPAEGREILTREQERLEVLSLALRTRRGIHRRELLSFPGAKEHLPRLLREGLLEETGERVAPTPSGFLLADRLPLLFL